MKQARLKIIGIVQGVFFRAKSRERALFLNLRGYAKNLPDRSVEILLQGKELDIEAFITWAKKGPEHANVKEVQVERIETQKEKADDLFTDFQIF